MATARASTVEGEGEQFLVWTPEGMYDVWTIEQICMAYANPHEDGFRPERIWHLPEALRGSEADGKRVDARIEVKKVGQAHDERCGTPTFEYYELSVLDRWTSQVLAKGEYSNDLSA